MEGTDSERDCSRRSNKRDGNEDPNGSSDPDLHSTSETEPDPNQFIPLDGSDIQMESSSLSVDDVDGPMRPEPMGIERGLLSVKIESRVRPGGRTGTGTGTGETGEEDQDEKISDSSCQSDSGEQQLDESPKTQEEESVNFAETEAEGSEMESNPSEPLPSSAFSVDPGSEDFFVQISSIKIKYEDSQRRTINEFQFAAEDEADGQIGDQLWPTLGGWNVDDLYGEVLYSVVHTLTNKDQPKSEDLVAHLQQAFHIDNDKHKKLLEAARDKQAPPLVLNLEVIAAKGLKGKDVNGLSDPFCTIYVSPKQKHNTSMKPATLSPIWREYFSLPITSLQDEILSIEVWDYDPEETLADKMKRFGEVKSTRGLRILMKEIALTASTGKTAHEFLGCLKIPLKNIPADGFDKWFPLEGKNGNSNKKKGDIHLRMVNGTEKDKKVAAQEYRHVLHLLLVHELDVENVQPHLWNGDFASEHAKYILHQLRWQGGLLPSDIDMAKWLVYTRVQCEHPLSAKLFPPLFASIMAQHNKEALSDDDMRKFWFASDKLVENFSGVIRNIHQNFLNPSTFDTDSKLKKDCIEPICQTLGQLKDHLTAVNSQGQKAKKDLEGRVTVEYIVNKMENAISRGAEDLFNSIAKSEEEVDAEAMIRIGQLLIADLRKGLDLCNSAFQKSLGIDFFETTYRVYDDKYGELVEPLVKKICNCLKPLDLRDDSEFHEEQDVSTGTSLFELYLAVKQFADLSSNLSSKKDLSIEGSFHTWFHSSVAQWLDIAWYKASKRIQKAVQLDVLRPVDDYVQFSSSAVDTAHIFHQIQIFWNQLSWPDVEGEYTFIAKILDDLCKCIIYYAKIMCKKVDEMERRQGEKYEISNELCLAINNIEYVGLAMKPISTKLEMEKILAQLKVKNGPEIADQCRRTLVTVMENATENINDKIYDILAKVGAKMESVIFRLLLEGAETEVEEEGIDKLMKYLDKNLIRLKQKMTPTGFDKVFYIICENASVALKDLIRTNIEKRRPPEFFKRIHNMLQILQDFFYPDGVQSVDSAENSNIREIQDLIGLHGASTGELILKFSQDRYKQQTKVKSKTGENGLITIRATYCDDIHTLRIEILNCRHLKPHDSNGQCDPYVKIQLVPHELYPIPSKKTKVKKKTLFPLFDETFSIPLTPDEMSLGGLIYMSVKDHDMFGRNEFMGEAFVPLESIPFTMSDTKLQDLPQVHLALTTPNDNMSIILQTLENRHWDRQAVDFAKKERLKQGGGASGNIST